MIYLNRLLAKQNTIEIGWAGVLVDTHYWGYHSVNDELMNKSFPSDSRKYPHSSLVCSFSSIDCWNLSIILVHVLDCIALHHWPKSHYYCCIITIIITIILSFRWLEKAMNEYYCRSYMQVHVLTW